MSRLANAFTKSESPDFIPFITAGDPDMKTTVELALALQEIGARVLELGIPYSDPLADGPVIQRASIRALDGGMTLLKAMELVPVMREKGLTIPVICFTYYNLLMQLGEDRFIELAVENELDGVLVPDLPFEESDALRAKCRAHGLALISLVAPTTSDARLAKIGAEADGFLYCVSSLGVTGVRQTFRKDVFNFLERVRAASRSPIAVGFGISSKEHVAEFNNYCDAFIVGSAIVREIESRVEPLQDEATRAESVQEIKQVLKQKFF
ncbi:tryptophan synthase subunit alpha [Pullulanibacillus sp. KACC 23026]|uniref:tryptophan synthase subunit alpha n=1 Tax=Pullulanibacillus sp. KACC 23026 TaxID=3028315 RepID=UPI0023B1F21D|nr:tryptophan synthase subunit alpha [Pullulanibacillus sp. KACC 23026]WEG11365.1 tryptophan synthase subunit alpha [Pullulanibacillus sp. KACC 23026]